MTTPFWCLLVVAWLPYLLSTLGGAVRMRQPEGLDNKHPRQQQARLEGLPARLVAAQQNAWEALPFFAAGVVTAHLAGADPGASATAAVVFTATRLVHPIAYAANLDVVRSAIFLVGLAANAWLFVLAARVGP